MPQGNYTKEEAINFLKKKKIQITDDSRNGRTIIVTQTQLMLVWERWDGLIIW